MSEDAEEEAGGNPEAGSGRGPYRVRLPRFLAEEDVGLGEAVTRMAAAVGIRACGGCRSRAAALDRWLTFTGGRRR